MSNRKRSTDITHTEKRILAAARRESINLNVRHPTGLKGWLRDMKKIAQLTLSDKLHVETMAACAADAAAKKRRRK